MPKGYFEPVKRPILLQTGPLEYTPIFGAKALEEKGPEEQVETIVFTPVKAHPLPNYEKMRTIIMSNEIYESFESILFFSLITPWHDEKEKKK
ncbi:MAG: hypothetical protein QXH24_02510 [Candidatus Bathyarchaeia archaeon]